MNAVIAPRTTPRLALFPTPRPALLPAPPSSPAAATCAATILFGPDGSVAEMTPEAQALFARHGAANRLSFYSLVHAKNLYRVLRDVAEMICEGRTQAQWIVRLRTADGRWRWFEARVQNELEGPAAALRVSLHEA